MSLLEDVFGSDIDLASGGEGAEPDDSRRSTARKKKQMTTAAASSAPSNDAVSQKRPPIQFSDSDNDDEVPRRKREDLPVLASKDSGDDEIRPNVRPRDDEDRYSSDDDQAAARHDDRRRRRRDKNKQRRRKKPRLEKPADRFDDGDGDERRALSDSGDEHAGEHLVEEKQPEPEKSSVEKAIESHKALRRQRKKELDPNQVEADCVHFLERMMKARDDDMKAYKSGKPALNKLRMLRDVEIMCTKITHREQLLDNMLLAIMKAWLDPIPPDAALPNVEIRTSLLKILSDFRVDSSWVERLESSQGIGKVIHFYSIKDPHPPNKRLAEKLMMKWARPVYKSNANFHDLLEELGRPEDGYRSAKTDGIAYARQVANRSISKMKTTQDKNAEFKSKVGKEKRQVLARVPTPNTTLYSRLPENNNLVDDRFRQATRSNRLRTQKVNRTMARMRAFNKATNASASKPSVNGRD